MRDRSRKIRYLSQTLGSTLQIPAKRPFEHGILVQHNLAAPGEVKNGHRVRPVVVRDLEHVACDLAGKEILIKDFARRRSDPGAVGRDDRDGTGKLRDERPRRMEPPARYDHHFDAAGDKGVGEVICLKMLIREQAIETGPVCVAPLFRNQIHDQASTVAFGRK